MTTAKLAGIITSRIEETRSDLCRRWRAQAGARGTAYPVVVVPGNKCPSVEGECQHYVTQSGERVHFPSAYRAAFGRPIYVPSTIRVEVGLQWLQRSIPGLYAELTA